ncbi:MAG: methyltransferase domain-containing protein [Pseudomonadota bacterium]
MRTDVLDFHEFYRTPLGRRAADFVCARLQEAWGDARGMRVAGFGYANPFLNGFSAAERVLDFAPASQGVARWPAKGANAACLIQGAYWPLPDASIDRLLIVHGLEEARDPRRLMREVWRVLAPEGRVIAVVANRVGAWSTFSGTPYAAGRPYSRGQLTSLLTQSSFSVSGWSGALYFPPVNSSVLLRAAPSWERAGARVWPSLCGVIMAEALKELIAPVGKVATEGVLVQRRARVRRAPAAKGAARRATRGAPRDASRDPSGRPSR